MGQRGNVSRLFLKNLNEFDDALALSGTEGAFNPFFSPNGDWIGFFTATELRKISLSGGTPQTLGSVSYPVGASWGADGTIILSQNEARVISRISEDGGTAERVTDLPGNRVWWPQILPGGRSILVLCSQSLFRFADLGDDGLCRGGPDKGCGVIVSAIDVVVDRLD